MLKILDGFSLVRMNPEVPAFKVRFKVTLNFELE